MAWIAKSARGFTCSVQCVSMQSSLDQSHDSAGLRNMLASGENFSDYSVMTPAPVDIQCSCTAHLYINAIPDIILTKIFAYLTPQELCNSVVPVCKYWKQLAFCASLWKNVILHVNSLEHSWDIKRLLSKKATTIESLSFFVKSEKLNCEAIVAAETVPYLPALKHLDLGFNKGLELAVVDFLVDQCPNVISANFEGSKEVNDRSVEVMAIGWLLLEELNLSHCISVTNAGVVLVAQRVTRLRLLNIDGISSIEDSTIGILAEVRKGTLEELYLDGEDLSDISIYSLSHCHRLRTLSISFCEAFSDSILDYLKNMSHLEHLHLKKGMDLQAGSFVKVFDSHTFSDMRFLCLAECSSLNDLALDAVTRNCVKLESLSLTWCWSVTDEGLMYIGERLNELRLLGLVGLDLIKGNVFGDVPQLYLKKIRLIDLRQCNVISDDIVTDMIKRKSDLTVMNYYGEILDKDSIFQTSAERAHWTQRENVQKNCLRRFPGGCCMCSL